MKKVKINKEACIGCGSCVGICDTVFQFDNDGFAEVIKTVDFDTLNDEIKNEVVDALESCPTSAIEYIEEEKK